MTVEMYSESAGIYIYTCEDMVRKKLNNNRVLITIANKECIVKIFNSPTARLKRMNNPESWEDNTYSEYRLPWKSVYDPETMSDTVVLMHTFGVTDQ